MTASIGQNIKRLRRERDITQESLAEYLGITAQAVSGWECDRCSPDIAQLPLLANIFGVTTDEILGVNVSVREAKIDEICASARKVSADGCRDEAVRILRRGLLDYPNAYKIMENLAGYLYLTGSFDESEALNRKVLQECTDPDLRASATSNLCFLYDHLGKKDKAISLAMSIPELSRNDLLRDLYEGEERIRFLRENSLDLFSDALYQSSLIALGQDAEHHWIHTVDERLAIFRKIVAVYEILLEDGDYNFFAQFMESAHYWMAGLYAEKQDAENTLRCLRKMSEFTRMFLRYPGDAAQTSLLFRGVQYGGWVKSTPDAVSAMLRENLDYMAEARFDFIRDRAEFAEIAAMNRPEQE